MPCLSSRLGMSATVGSKESAPKRAKVDGSGIAAPFTPIVVRTVPDAVQGRLEHRERFLGKVKIQGQAPGTPLTDVHMANTGPLSGLAYTFPQCWLSRSDNAKRKTAYTVEALKDRDGGAWVGVHSASANGLVKVLLEQRMLTDLLPYTAIRQEVRYGKGKTSSRVDFVLDTADGGEIYVEVKSVSMAERRPPATRDAMALLAALRAEHSQEKIALFPDTVSLRAQQHVRELMRVVAAGKQAAVVFVIQRSDCSHFGVSHDSDPAFGKLLIAAAAAGVRILALRVGVDISPVMQAGTFTYLGPAAVDLDFRSDSWGCPLTNDA